jgi:hypothetical protein
VARVRPLVRAARAAQAADPDDLGSTIALSGNAAPSFGAFAAPSAVSFGAPSAPSFGVPSAPSFGAPPVAPTFGAPPVAPSFGAPPGGVAFSPPQSQIETAMALPRPDASVLWAAQQAQQPKRSAWLLVAVVALTALSVIGIGALVYFRVLARAPAPTGGATPASEAPADGPASKPSSTGAAAATVASPPAASSTTTPATTSAATSAPASTGQPAVASTGAATAGGAPAKEEDGFLTLVCSPSCDEVVDGGRSLGAPPIVRVPLKPGQHRLTIKAGDKKKVIPVIIVSGQTTTQRVSMK